MSAFKKIILRIVVWFTFLVPLFAYDISVARSWLVDEINANTLVENGDDIVLPYQAAREAMLALVRSNLSTNVENSMLFAPFAYDENTTEFLASKIIALKASNTDTKSAMNRLLSLQNPDGGFGHSKGHQSSVLDTAYALSALALTNEKLSSLRSAVDFLIRHQNTDGSWSDLSDTDVVFTTSIVLRSLWQQRKKFALSDTLEKAKDFLVGSSVSDETFTEAVVLRAIAPFFYDKQSLIERIDRIKLRQMSDGSWDESIYTTALAIQALDAADKDVPNPDLGSIAGIVVDADTDSVLSGIDVELVSATTLDTQTNSQGRFTFSGLRNATYALHISNDHYAPIDSTLRVYGDSLDIGTIRLHKDANSTVSILTGKVTDASTSQPLAGAEVHIGGNTVITDDSGVYTINNLTPGAYGVAIVKNGYIRDQRDITIPANTLMYYNAALYRIDHQVKAQIKGRVLDRNGSIPLSGVHIVLSGSKNEDIATKGDGTFVLTDIGQGAYALRIEKNGYRSVRASGSIDQTVVIDMGDILLSQMDPSDNLVRIRGKIVDKQTRQGLSGVRVAAGSIEAFSDGEGKYEIEGDIAGDLNITASKDGYRTVGVTTSAQEGSTLIFSPAMTKNNTDLSVSGTVLDDNSSLPLDHVIVKLVQDDNLTTYTDENGYYSFSHVTKGDAALYFAKDGYNGLALNFKIGDRSVDVSPSLKPRDGNLSDNNASIQGIVKDVLTKNVLAAVSIVATSKFDRVSAITDDSGRFVLEGLRGYDYNLSFSLADYKDVKRNAYLQAGENFDMGVISMRPALNRPLIPDLTLLDVQFDQGFFKNDKVTFDGNAVLKVANIGGMPTEEGFAIYAFYDVDRDGNFTDGTDIIFGTYYINDTLDIDENKTVTFPVKGRVPFANAPISFFVDAKTQIVESDESNNIYAYNSYCGNVSSVVSVNSQAKRVKWAIEKASDYVAPVTVDWDKRKRCIGCHIQSQTVAGLYGSMAKARVDEEAAAYLLDRIKNEQLPNGSIRSTTGRSNTQTAFALWAFSYVSDVNKTIRERTRMVNYFLQRARYSGNSSQAYWLNDHSTGWLRTTQNITSLMALNISRYINDAQHFNDLNQTERQIVEDAKKILPKVGRYLLSVSSQSTNNNIQLALWIVGLSEVARQIDTDTALSEDIKQRLDTLTDQLRQRQNDDGGWKYVQYYTSSDPLTSAWVGFALDYRRFEKNDLTILRNIDFLLRTQDKRGYWNTNSGLFSTKLGTTGLVIAYLPVALDYLDSADLSVSRVKLIDSDSGTVTLKVRVGNAGSDKLRRAVTVVVYDGNSSLGSLLATQTIDDLGKWEYKDIVFDDLNISKNDIYIRVDDKDYIHECNEINNALKVPAIATLLSVALQVSTNKPTYGTNEIADLSASVTNLGQLKADLSAQLILQDDQGNIVKTFDEHPLGIVASKETKEIFDEWNTTTTFVGEYVLKGILKDRDGNIVVESNTSFSIVSGSQGASLGELALSTDRYRYRTTDSMTITNVIKNISPNSVIKGAKVRIKLVDPQGRLVKEQNLTAGDLFPKSTKEVNTYDEFARLPEGIYTLQASLYDQDDTLYDKKTVAVMLYEQSAMTIKGSVSLAWDENPAGTTQECTYALSSFSSIDPLRSKIQLRLIDFQSGSIEQTIQSDEELSALQSVTKTKSLPTKGLRKGMYSCALYVLDTDDKWKLMDHRMFRLTNAPPIAENDAIETNENTPVVIDVLENDHDNEDDVNKLHISIIDPPKHGSVSIVGAQVVYRPQTNFSGNDHFAYVVSDSGGLVSHRADVDIYVPDTNKPPVAKGRSLTVDKNDYLDIVLSGEDSDGDDLTYQIVRRPKHGALRNSPPDVLYVPKTDYVGDDYFAFKVNDGAVDSNVAVVNIRIRDKNHVGNCCGCQNYCGCSYAQPSVTHQPVSIKLKVASVTANSATIEWEDTTKHRRFYVVYLDGNAVEVLDPDVKRYTIEGLSPESNHTVYLKVYTDTGSGDSPSVSLRSGNWGWLPAIYLISHTKGDR